MQKETPYTCEDLRNRYLNEGGGEIVQPFLKGRGYSSQEKTITIKIPSWHYVEWLENQVLEEWNTSQKLRQRFDKEFNKG